jgi:hypothetical protein
VAIARACDERVVWIVNPASLWTASGPARWQSICWKNVRKRCAPAPALRRLCATSSSSFFSDQDAEQRPASIDWPARGHHVE